MPMSVLFWLLYILLVVLGCWGSWPPPGSPRGTYGGLGYSLLLFALIGILGWRIFGPAVQ